MVVINFLSRKFMAICCRRWVCDTQCIAILILTGDEYTNIILHVTRRINLV